MPALNFQAQFAPLVESGEKRQTIRKLRKDFRDPKPGDTLYLYTGMRTKACRKLAVFDCKSATPIAIARSEKPWRATKHIVYSFEVWTGVRGEEHYRSRLSDRRVTNLARQDGFESAEAMVAWFEDTHGLPFEGLLIRW